MSALRLALSFVRIPRLFFSLLFWPLLLGIFIAIGQIVLMSAYFSTWNESPSQYEKRMQTEKYSSYIVSTLYGSDKLAPIQLCRWLRVNGKEAQPVGCAFEPHDVTLWVKSPADFEAAEYLKLFQGASPRVHLCQNCKTDVVINLTKAKPTIELFTLRAMGVDLLSKLNVNEELREHYLTARKKKAYVSKLLGNTIFSPPGLKNGIDLSVGNQSMILVINLAALILFTLWLALKAHRKVLDYFSRNNALLPLVASCGSGKFYRALWIITAMRVGCFLMASIPATYYFYSNVVPKKVLQHFMPNAADFLIWFGALLGSMLCVTMISSIADLKKRHTWLGFFYSYGPAICCAVGTIFWAGSIFSDQAAILFARDVVASLPIFGFVPIIASPVLKLDPNLLALHTLLSSAVTLWLLQSNSKWFASHVEEL